MVSTVTMPGFRQETLTLSSSSLNSRIQNPNPNFSNFRRRKPPNPQNVSRQSDHHPRSNSRTMVAKFSARHLVMGEVKILKRGESLAIIDNGHAFKENRKSRVVKLEKDSDLSLGSTVRLGPEPDIVEKQIRVRVGEIYAGSALATNSPPPSSVPVPGFLGKNRNCSRTATSDLRRLLGLDSV